MNEIGKWYIDGFCTSQIITPVKDANYLNGIRWQVVKRCISRDIADIRVNHHNKQTGRR